MYHGHNLTILAGIKAHYILSNLILWDKLLRCISRFFPSGTYACSYMYMNTYYNNCIPKLPPPTNPKPLAPLDQILRAKEKGNSDFAPLRCKNLIVRHIFFRLFCGVDIYEHICNVLLYI